MRKTVIAAIIFLLALGVGFLLFVPGPQGEKIDLEKRVDKLTTLQEKPVKEAPQIERPPSAELRVALQGAIKSSGIKIKDINRLPERTEISTQSDPAVVALFAEEVSRGPLLATAISGDAWPVSVVIIVPKYTLSQ